MATAPQGQAGGSEKKLQPIIIKRVKKSAHGVHGGAWKIAYADFVTAMMAFFLLMWLLGSTAKGDLQGIAAYFNSPLKVAMQGGDGAGNSSSIIPGGGTDLARISGQVKRSDADAATNRRRDIDAKARRAQEDAQRIKALQAKIEAVISSNATLNEYRSQIRMDITPDGLQIQIVDEQNRPMFDIGSAIVKPYMRVILREVGAALGGVENRISLAGHTDAAPWSAKSGTNNWRLSVDRAEVTRHFLEYRGIDKTRFQRIEGVADREPYVPTDRFDPRNRRISITLGWRTASGN